jgi:stage V sporulation protein AC
MDMNAEQYAALVKRLSPNSQLGRDLTRAFFVGGGICTLGQALTMLYQSLGAAEADAATWCSVTLIALSALLTGLGWYDELARFAGAGSLVPITGFSNAVASPALEFKTEGWVTGMAVKLFTIAGPVLVFGTAASVIYGGILCLTR